MTSARVMLVLAAAILAAAMVAGTAASTTPIRRSVIVVIEGRGTVTSKPQGISCPRSCRAYFPKDSQVRLVSRPAAGWRLSHWSGNCLGKTLGCAFYLTTEHDCSANLCRVGTFGVHVVFVRRAGLS